MTTSATLSVEIKKDNDFVRQIIKITPDKKSHLRYFTMDKYSMAREVEKLLDTIYLGDAVNVFFEEKQ